jgi:hypothetical protein
VLFSLGLDLLAAAPGFFIAAISGSSYRVAAAGRASELIICQAQLLRIIEICYVQIKRIAAKFRKKF